MSAVITQNERSLAFYNRALSSPQTKYSVSEQELLSIVECSKESKGMLWEQKIRVYTDHQNLVRDAFGLTSDRVYRWRLILEEYGLEIVYMPGVTNIVTDGLSRLEYIRRERKFQNYQCSREKQRSSQMFAPLCRSHFRLHTVVPRKSGHMLCPNTNDRITVVSGYPG